MATTQIATRDKMDGAITNDKGITPSSVKDPKPLPKLVGATVLVRPFEIEEKTKGGIILPDNARSDMAYLNTVGRVLSLGLHAYADETIYTKGPWCKVGDFVAYTKHAGQRFYWKGVQLLILREQEILMVLDDPGMLDDRKSP